MAKFVRVIDTARCFGCRSCVAACAVENHFTPEAPWNVMVEYESGHYPNVARNFVTMNCMHCEQPSCKAACDAAGFKAISKNEFGVVLVDYEKCTGCGYCSTTCPYGVPQLNGAKVEQLYPGAEKTAYEKMGNLSPLHRKKANTVEKCTFCWHKLEKAVSSGKIDQIGKVPEFTPTCDLVCPVNARIFGDIDDPKSAVSVYVSKKKATQLKKEFGTEPQVYYVLNGGDY
jgi:Fe-S-cluster-containing dehydrogenase component